MNPNQDVIDPLENRAEGQESGAGNPGENKDGEPKRAARPTRHAMIMRGIVTPIFGLLAVAAVALGILNATMWKPSSIINASATISGTQYVVTDPGVLPLLDRNATLNVKPSSSSTQVCVALGTSKDVAGWVASESSYQRITGLASWTSLATQQGKSTGAATEASDDNAVAFKDSDMWSQVKCGKGEVTLTSTKTADSTVAIVDLGKDASSAEISMRWVRSQVPDFAMPFYLSGGLLAVVAVLCASVFAMPPHKRRKRMVEGKAVIHTDLSFAERVEQGLVGTKLPESVPARKRRRHAAHRRGAKNESELESEQIETPVIVDPAARNMVADQQAQQSEQSEQPEQPEHHVFEAAESGAETGTQFGGARDGAHSAGRSAGHSGRAGSLDDQATSVITPDELQAYFSRLAREVQDGQSNGPDDADMVDNAGTGSPDAHAHKQEEGK